MKVGYKTLLIDTAGTSIDLGDLFIPKNLFTSGGLWLWGENQFGNLGTNSITDVSSPVQTVSAGSNWKQVSGNITISSGIKTDGTLWTWGYNLYGQLGDDSIVHKSSPVQTVAGGTNWKQVSCGNFQTTAIKTDGTLWLWGRNNYGQLGTNDTTDRSSPVQTISGGMFWKMVSGGRDYTAAIKTDGTLWTWGYNLYGQLGDNTTNDRSSPVQTISTGTTWKLVASGQYHTAAIKTDGTLWLWGRNNYGQLGINDRTNRSSPIQTITTGTTWKQVTCKNQTAAIKTDGTLWVWGLNDNGQLGDNSIANKSSPVQTVSGGTTWKRVFSGWSHTMAIKTDGTLWAWGRNNSGQLGDNTTVNKSSPVQTTAGGTNWKQVEGGRFSTLGIREDYY